MKPSEFWDKHFAKILIALIRSPVPLTRWGVSEETCIPIQYVTHALATLEKEGEIFSYPDHIHGFIVYEIKK